MEAGNLREEWLRPRRERREWNVVLARAWPSVLAGLAAGVLLLQLAFDAGGYFAPAYLPAGSTALAVCAFLIIARRERAAVSGSAAVALAALAAYAGWTGLSAAWSPTPDGAVAAMQRDLCLLGLFGLGLVAVGSGRHARQLVWGVLLVITIVCGAALLSRLQPDWVGGDQGGGPLGEFRLSYPLTYWNALGTLAAMGAVLSFGLSADPRTPWPLRATAGGLSVLLFTTMYLSLSRGAWLALIVGLVVLCAVGAHRGSLLLTFAAVGIPSVLAIARISRYDALIDDPKVKQGQEVAGNAFTVQLLVLVAVAVGTQGLIAAVRAQPELVRLAERVLRPLAIGLGAVVAIVLIGGYAWRSADAEGVAAEQIVSAQDWVSEQWDDFMQPAGNGGRGTSRLTSAGGTRSNLYRTALGQWSDHPLIGDGAGSFPRAWVRDREIDESVANAHSLEIETLGELGLVGAVLLLTFLGAITWAVVRSRLRPGALPRAQVGAVAGAVSVWVVASAVDWHWQVTALTGTALVLSCTLFPYGRGVRRRDRPRSHDLMDGPARPERRSRRGGSRRLPSLRP